MPILQAIPIPFHERIHVRDEADLHVAVATAQRGAIFLDFSEVKQLAVATCVSELATNILKYAGRGVIEIREAANPGPGAQAGDRGLEVVAKDHGPGIPDIGRAMRDHFSTSGTLGLGLPGIRRMSDDFSIVSAPGAGTQVALHVWRGGAARPAWGAVGREVRTAFGGTANELMCAAHRRPAPGETECGDRTLVRRQGGLALLAVVDGLGHGPLAAQAARICTRFLEDEADLALDPVAWLRRMHELLRGTRGAAAGLMRVDVEHGVAAAAGMGNVRMARISARSDNRDLHATQTDGVLGFNWRSPFQTQISLATQDLLLLASDGLPSHIGPHEMPELRRSPPTLLACELVEKFGKFHDDACCLAARWKAV